MTSKSAITPSFIGRTAITFSGGDVVEKLKLRKGGELVVTVVVRDPEGRVVTQAASPPS